MEVLRATEILEREINENAKKKAACILAEAESECKKIEENIDGRIKAMEKDEESSFQKKSDALKLRVEAAISLEQGRFLAEYIDRSVMSAINDYLNSLDEKRQLQLVQRQLEKYKAVLQGKKIVAGVMGFDSKVVQPVLASVFGNDLLGSCQPMDSKALRDNDNWSLPGLEVLEGVIVETEDGSTRCRSTFNEVARELIEFHGSDLVSTLFCGGLPQ